MIRLSLQGRVMASAAIVLLVFLGLTGWVLDRAFRDSAAESLQGRLQGQLHGLLGVAEFVPGKGLEIAGRLPEARLMRPGSGLIAQAMDADGHIVWQSESALGHHLPPLAPLGTDQARFHRLRVDGEAWFGYEYGLSWIDEQEAAHPYTFRITESPDAYARQVETFRRTMIAGLAFAAIMLLIVQALILRWGLRPLRRIEQELAGIEGGRSERLNEDYPRELKGLARNLNLLIDNERRHLQRYRHTLADLAHSLKTPLAVLRAAVDGRGGALARLVDEQVNGMNDLVEYQLQKAAAAGTTSFSRGVAVRALVERIIGSMEKVYRDKAIRFRNEVPEDAVFHGESGDLMEMLGNLIDNACKWCDRQVRVSAAPVEPGNWRRGVRLAVEDDGPGIDASRHDDILQRGVRDDSRVPGHGIGLAVVSEIVASYGGTVDIERSPLGGAGISMTLTSSPP